MTAPKLPAKQQPVTPRSIECSPELWRRLRAGRDFLEVWADTANDSALRQELTDYLPSLKERARPAEPPEVIAALLRLVTVYGVGDRPEEEWATFWEVYAEALEGVPAEAVRAGARDYVAKPDSEFFPKPGPLLALCEPHAHALRRALTGATVILDTDPLKSEGIRGERHQQIEAMRARFIDAYRASGAREAEQKRAAVW